MIQQIVSVRSNHCIKMMPHRDPKMPAILPNPCSMLVTRTICGSAAEQAYWNAPDHLDDRGGASTAAERYLATNSSELVLRIVAAGLPEADGCDNQPGEILGAGQRPRHESNVRPVG